MTGVGCATIHCAKSKLWSKTKYKRKKKHVSIWDPRMSTVTL